MSFANPTALYFLPLVAIPILIHLLGRKTRYRLKFPWIKLLEKARTEGIRRKKPYEILLLILRTLFLLFLILAFSNPVKIRDVKDIKTVWIDVSHSMAPFQNESKKFEERIRELLPDAEVKYFADRELPLEKPEKTYFSTSFRGIEGRSMVFSDFQRTMFEGEQVKGKLILVRPRKPTGNVAILELTPGSEYAFEGMPLPIELRVRSFALEPWSGKVELKTGTTTLSAWDVYLKPGESVILRDTIAFQGDGELTAALSPGDEMDGDDRRFAFVSKISEVNVVMDAHNRYVEAALTPIGVQSPFSVTVSGKTVSYSDVSSPSSVPVFVDSLTTSAAALIGVLRSEKRGMVVFVGDSVSVEVVFRELGIRLNPIGPTSIGEYRVFNAWEVTGGTPLLRDSRGRALVASVDGAVVWGFRPVPEVTNFIYSPDFLPLVHLSMLTAARHLRVYYVFPDTVLNLPVTEAGRLKLIQPDSTSHSLSISQGKEGNYVTVGPFHDVGFYRLVDWDGSPIAVIVVNLNPEESDITPIDKKTLSSFLTDFEMLSAGEEGGIPLKKLFLWLAALMVLIEVGVMAFLRIKKI